MAQFDPQTETSVAIQALSELLLPAITDLVSDTSQAARVLRKFFAVTRDSLQRQYPWNYCEAEATLNVDPDAPASARFRYSYLLPGTADQYCLRALDLHGVHRREWKVVGRRLLTNVGPQVILIFTRRVTEVPLWDALFRSAFVLALAYACKELCKDQERLAEIKADAKDALTTAWPADASEGVPHELPMPDVLASRFDGGCDEPWRRD